MALSGTGCSLAFFRCQHAYSSVSAANDLRCSPSVALSSFDLMQMAADQNIYAAPKIPAPFVSCSYGEIPSSQMILNTADCFSSGVEDLSNGAVSTLQGLDSLLFSLCELGSMVSGNNESVFNIYNNDFKNINVNNNICNVSNNIDINNIDNNICNINNNSKCNSNNINNIGNFNNNNNNNNNKCIYNNIFIINNNNNNNKCISNNINNTYKNNNNIYNNYNNNNNNNNACNLDSINNLDDNINSHNRSSNINNQNNDMESINKNININNINHSHNCSSIINNQNNDMESSNKNIKINNINHNNEVMNLVQNILPPSPLE